MTTPRPASNATPEEPPRRLARWLIAIALLALLVAVFQARRALPGSWISGREGVSTITQAVVVERIRAVAQLVTSETTLRDVVVYETTWMGSTKRSLVVVTGRVLAGIDLDAGTSVHIDDEARRITIALPRARILAVDVGDMRTYDEQRGLWNTFQPRDRDAIFRLARGQLMKAAEETGVTGHAEQSAVELLQRLLSSDGYVAEVSFPTRLEPAAPRN